MARGDEGVKRGRAEFGACKKTPPKIRQAVEYSLGLLLGSALFPAPPWAQWGWATFPHWAHNLALLPWGRWEFGMAVIWAHPQLPDRVMVGPLCKGMLLGLSSTVLLALQSKIGSE